MSGSVEPHFLVIGSGIAGLYFALKAARHGQVTLVTKDSVDNAATTYAQGGIAAALGSWDNPEKHMADTLAAGAGLCDEKAVAILVREGVERVRELIGLGMPFTRSEDGSLHFGREGGHNESRVLHTYDHTGRALESFLLERVQAEKNIRLLPNHCVVELATEHHLPQRQNSTTVYGAYVLNASSGEIQLFTADYTILATGGAGRVYPVTTNPPVSTGDGVALAYRAGCRVRNMEFFQFHPTALALRGKAPPGIPAFLITEAMRGEGAILKNPKTGRAFMQDYHPMRELAPRDIVARAIDCELKRDGLEFVWLDISHRDADFVRSHFPSIYNTLREKFNIDITLEPIPVVPAAHYMCGGVLVDYDSQTDLSCLYAIGEVASTGVHGGNRLASNSLLEALVFAERALRHILKHHEAVEALARRRVAAQLKEWDHSNTKNAEEWVLLSHDFKEIRSIMWDYVGIVRSNLRLERALRRIDVIYGEIIDFYNRTVITRDLLELRNLALVAQLIVRSALARKESRGLHFNTDYPENREPSRNDTILSPAHFNPRAKQFSAIAQ
ncbi:MAG: L-aspartate oxidase [Turneriella sp.]|nr:L-aspartate oxidase [Turneriella sp.]